MSTNPVLREGYRRAAKLTWQYGTTYYWGALLLPRPQRKHVYAVYALCRLADDIVDLPDPMGGNALDALSPARFSAQSHERSVDRAQTPSDAALCGETSVGERLEAFADQFRTALIDRGSDDPVMAAIVHSVITCGIEPECFDRFFGAMAMDLTTSTYETWGDLCGYMEGSAAVIGEMMLPVLEPTSPKAKAPARSLGLAFQLTNFLRDVDEDLDRGRVYMPQEDLRHFGVDLTSRAATPEWRAFLAYEIERNRALYSFADTGIALLPPRSARCVGTARVLYAQILEKIEQRNYDVFSSRARVPTWRKAATAARIMVAGPPRPSHAELDQSRNPSHVTSNAQ